MGTGTATMLGREAPPLSLPDTDGDAHELPPAGEAPALRSAGRGSWTGLGWAWAFLDWKYVPSWSKLPGSFHSRWAKSSQSWP